MNEKHITSYKTLFERVCQIYEATIVKTESAGDSQSNYGYLHMGQQIDGMLSEAEQTGHYGKRLVPNLCRDLKKKYGDGPSTRTIHYMRKFAALYSDDTIHPQLPWSHYCILLSVENAKTRAALENQAIQQRLGRAALQQLVSYTNQQAGQSTRAFPLSPRNATPNIVKLIRPKGDGHPLLDLGFGVLQTPSSSRMAQFKTGTHLKRYTNGHFSPVTCAPGERYCYPATLDSVVDGDTVKLQVQLSGGLFIQERFRLRGIDAMEISTPEGQKAKRALQRLLQNKNTIIIYTYSTDRYGRYVADIVADGNYINKTMVQNGHARFLSMRTE
ncbi:MAG: thermonuclease family protein [Deltaproteobacteria bacterium]|nr:thermonuclease family protein [Deltaproteobacteria bacterium]